MNQQPLPPADGEVTLHTSLGDVIVELWSKEAPRAVRNFVQLCLNQSYERCQFHTVKKDVLIQTGDPTNTGSGGASSTPGTPIPCEPAKKLKLSTRGMVAMPGGDAGEIGSQFFITLQPVPALQGNYTIIGRVVAESIYPAVRISEVPCEGERPVDAPFIKGTTINRNPYDDMFAQDTTRREVEDEVWQSRKRKAESTTRGKKARKAVKDRSKLGFDDEDAQDRPTDAVSTFVKSAKIISAHDILEDSDLAKQSVYTDEQKKQIKRERDEFERKNGMKGDSRTERIKNKINKREARYADLGDEDDDAYDAMDAPPLRQLSAAEIEQSEARKAAAKAEQDSLIAELRKNRPSDSSAAGGPEKKKTAGSAYLDEQRAKFAKRKSGIDREKESFLKMESWRRTLKKEKRKEAAPTQEDAEAADAPVGMRATSYADDIPQKGAKGSWFQNQIRFVNPAAEMRDKPLVDETYRVEDPLLLGEAPSVSAAATAKRQRAEDIAIANARSAR